MVADTVSFKYLVLFALVTLSLAAVSDDWACFNDAECGFNEVCCNGKCVLGSCSTPSSGCSSDFDCPDAKFCCDGKCKDGDCSIDLGNHTIVIVLGAVAGFIAVVSVISVCCCRRQRTVTIERTVVTTEEPLFHDCVPSFYQQNCPYPHPAQFGQPQMHVPPTYNPRTSAASARLPPYTTASTGRLGGVYTPKPSYGALQSAHRV